MDINYQLAKMKIILYLNAFEWFVEHATLSMIYFIK